MSAVGRPLWSPLLIDDRCSPNHFRTPRWTFRPARSFFAFLRAPLTAPCLPAGNYGKLTTDQSGFAVAKPSHAEDLMNVNMLTRRTVLAVSAVTALGAVARNGEA